MDGPSDEAPAGAPLAAHFEAKRRILATVKDMEARGEKLQEATPEEVFEAADKAAQSVFRFDFSLSDTTHQPSSEQSNETSAKKRNRNRKKHKKKKKGKKTPDEAVKEPTTSRPVTPPQRNDNVKSKQNSSFLKLRKATGTESETTKMHLKYGHGRRNLAATQQRERRKKDEHHDKVTSDFRFNFAAA